MMFTQHLLINGYVQGVGYRAYTVKKALSLGVTGWVRNLDDGRVEILAQAEKEVLSGFLSILKVGPPRAQVDSISIELVEQAEVMKEFIIESDGEKIWSNE